MKLHHTGLLHYFSAALFSTQNIYHGAKICQYTSMFCYYENFFQQNPC